MKLTQEEVQEKIYLENLQSSRTMPMMQSEFDRLRHLNAKEFHNHCSNIHCTGYEGSDEEVDFIKGGSKLHKTI